jgi:hypothetical protein
MRHLVRSFQENVGRRGTHFYDETSCNFLTWSEVIKFVDSLSLEPGKNAFAEKLTETLANYDPDNEFLAVQQSGNSVSVELYSQSQMYENGKFLQ